ncbi:Cro/CI family transcriptional regulator [Streptococcus pneumoniae MNZ11b]|nr:Cro/CI family transcriptional regulator [Streptococcus pneumoniae MNZ11b]
MMRLANGIVLDKDTTFGELKFSALRREVRIQNEDGSVSDEIKERTYDLKSKGQGRMIQVSIPASVPLKEFDYNARVELINPIADTVATATYQGADVDWYIKADDIETGKVKPSEDLQQSLWEALERFNPDAPLEMLFDYVRIRFPTTDVQQVVENILQLKLSYFLHEDYGFYSYSEHYALGDIFVLCSHELDKGVLVELKGRGCRQFESYLLAQQRSWYEFFMDVLVAGGVMKRLDLAINDKTGILNIPVLTEKCQQEECISVFRSFKSYRSGELVRKEEKECMGNTLYIGSLQSEVYFCIYEKDYEQYKKNDIPIEDAEVKNRFEIRLKNERAYYAVRDLLVYDNPEHTAFKIINRYIRFVDKDDSKPRSDWKLNEEWAWFIGNNRERLKLTTKPEPYSFQRTLNWLSHQVAPTLKVAIKLDEINQTQVVKDILDHAKLTDRHKQILKQQSVKEQDVITTKK